MAIILDKIAKIVTAKKIVIINNWDNISSKGFFWYKPDLLRLGVSNVSTRPTNTKHS